MYGKGILKGLGVTLKRYWNTYWDDIVWLFQGKKRYNTAEGIAHRSSSKTRGIFTVQYPEEKLLLPEEARYVPFLVYDEGADGKKEVRCTSCGICAKVCPPQCIWIVRTTDPETKRPKPEPAEFTVDGTVCMSCGLCMDCERCWMYCTTNCFEKLPKGQHYRINLEACNGCRKCADECPCGYIDMV